jgi:hypothetical protein
VVTGKTGADASIEWTDESTFRIRGVEYACRPYRRRFRSSADRFCLLKPRWSVELYEELLRDLRPRRLVELGVSEGGSTAFFAQLTEADMLLAIDVKKNPSDALEQFIDTHTMRDRVRVHYGVNQLDTRRLRELLDVELGDARLDLVVDDASHRVTETRASFNALFPRLREDGVYLIEDWSWAHSPLPIWEDETPLTLLVFELILACAHEPAALAEVAVNRGWARVRRGPAKLDGFDLSACYSERGRKLVSGL